MLLFHLVLVQAFKCFYLRHSGHVDDVSAPGPEHLAFSFAGEPRPFDRDHGALLILF